MLVDHLIEIPEPVEERFDNVGKDLFVLDSVTAQDRLNFSKQIVHSIRDCIIINLPISMMSSSNCCSILFYKLYKQLL